MVSRIEELSSELMESQEEILRLKEEISRLESELADKKQEIETEVMHSMMHPLCNTLADENRARARAGQGEGAATSGGDGQEAAGPQRQSRQEAPANDCSTDQVRRGAGSGGGGCLQWCRLG